MRNADDTFARRCRYDIFLTGQLDAYHGFNEESQVDHEHSIVIDPLGHCSATQFFNNSVSSRVNLPLLQLLDMIAKQNVTPPLAREAAKATIRAKWPSVPTFPTSPENAKNVVRRGGPRGRGWRGLPSHTHTRSCTLTHVCSRSHAPSRLWTPADVLRHGRFRPH